MPQVPKGWEPLDSCQSAANSTSRKAHSSLSSIAPTVQNLVKVKSIPWTPVALEVASCCLQSTYKAGRQKHQVSPCTFINRGSTEKLRKHLSEWEGTKSWQSYLSRGWFLPPRASRKPLSSQRTCSPYSSGEALQWETCSRPESLYTPRTIS